jgi:HlyD family secretion protein
MKKLVLIVLVLAGIGAAGFYFYSEQADAEANAPRPTVTVTRATIVDKVLAIGTIEPENEISVKSKIAGVVKKIYKEEGEYVKAGQALLEVKPDPTPLELTEANQQVSLQALAVNSLKREMDRQKMLLDQEMVSASVYDEFRNQFEAATMQLDNARARLELLESGRVTIDGTEIESIIRAPISGYLLTKSIEVGDPVTPLTSFQEGTVLMRMANMDRLIFKGTVDETDVGKLQEEMPVELKIGALPNAEVTGRLDKIWLKSEKQDNSTVFPVEIIIGPAPGIVLRAGYSANADVIIEKRENVLTIPERVVYFRNDSSFVKLPLPDPKEEERTIITGLSDAINIEVIAGLEEGAEILEKPVKEIQ